MGREEEQLETANVRSYKAHQAREAAFEQWWRLSYENRTLPRTIHGIARQAYFAAWGGGNRDALVKALEEMLAERGGYDPSCDCKCCTIISNARAALAAARTRS